MKKEVLKVGLDFSAPIPLHTDYSSKKFEGFEVDLMNRIAKELNLELRYIVLYWKGILRDLQNGKIDVICSAATITSERQKEFNFSKPYLHFHLCIVSHKDSLISFSEFVNQKVGVRINTEAEKYIKNNVDNVFIQSFDTNNEIYESLQQKKLNALIDDSPIAGGLLRQYSKLTISDFLPNSSSQYAIIINKENMVLKNKIDKVIDKLQGNGFLENNAHKWFNEIEL
jgi:ABC-type amino acid transport substrate-binding protein